MTAAIDAAAYRARHAYRSEAAFQAAVAARARALGWTVHLVPDALYRRSFPTRAAREAGARGKGLDLGDRGFPDLLLVRGGPDDAGQRVLFRELKLVGGRLSEHQERWRDALVRAGCDWAVWTPADESAIDRALGATA